MRHIEQVSAGRREWAAAFLPVILAALIYVFSAGGRAVTDYDEGYYVQPAMHMVESGDWITPYADGVRFLEKPPLLYWVTAASFKIFGVHEFALRLPTALAVVALVWIVSRIVRMYGTRQEVFAASLGTAFSVGTYLFTRETLHDIWLVLFLTLSVYAFLRWYRDPARPLGPALLFYGAMAGGFLCKSLVGAAFPIVIAVLFLLVSRDRPGWKALHLLPGTLLFLLLTVPWHWMAAVRNEGFLHYFFVEEQILRFLGLRELPVLWSVPLWLFWALIPLWFFPWTAFLPAAFSAIRKPENEHHRVLVRIALVWILVVLGFFSLSARLEHYAFPAIPALAILVAAGMKQPAQNKAPLWGFRVLALLGVLALLFGIVAFAWMAAGSGPGIAPAAAPNRIAETDFSIMAEMPREMVESLMKPAAVTILGMAAGFGAALLFETRRRRMQALMSVAAVMMVVCAMTHWSMRLCQDLISSKKFGTAIAGEAREGDRVVVVGDYESANSLNFYEPLPVEVVAGTAYALIPGMQYPDSPKVVLSPDEFKKAWDSAERVFALIRQSDTESWGLQGSVLVRSMDRVLLLNHR